MFWPKSLTVISTRTRHSSKLILSFFFSKESGCLFEALHSLCWHQRKYKLINHLKGTLGFSQSHRFQIFQTSNQLIIRICIHTGAIINFIHLKSLQYICIYQQNRSPKSKTLTDYTTQKIKPKKNVNIKIVAQQEKWNSKNISRFWGR